MARRSDPTRAAGALAAESGLSGYDAAFLAAARRLGIALVTGDDRLVDAGAGDAVHLGTIDVQRG